MAVLPITSEDALEDIITRVLDRERSENPPVITVNVTTSLSEPQLEDLVVQILERVRQKGRV